MRKVFLSRKEKISAVVDILENCKFDILYMNKLKKPLDKIEERYFQDQIGRINGAIQFLQWLGPNIGKPEKKSFWRKIWNKNR